MGGARAFRAFFMQATSHPDGFRALALSPRLHDLLDKLNFSTPTPIQAKAIPHLLEGRDFVGIAQTGTGKTLAFVLPIIHRLRDLDGPALILVPTRELALQVDEVFRKVGGAFGLKSAVLIGGAPMAKQIGQLRARPAAIIATPGRLMDHLEQRTASLKHISIAVLDEADRMLDMGFAPAIRKIMAETPEERQTMLFSATMPKAIAEIAADFLVNPVRVEIHRPGTSSELVSQELYVVEHLNKGEMLGSLLEANQGSTLIFARTRHGARKVAKQVMSMGHTAAELHSDRTLAQRKMALQGFKSGNYRILVATDIAARGIDVKAISLVINYDLPDNPDDYVHRIGRTGRAGEKGHAITLATPEQSKDIRNIERVLDAEIPLAEASPLSFAKAHAPSRPASFKFKSKPAKPAGGKPKAKSAAGPSSAAPFSKPATPQGNHRRPHGQPNPHRRRR
jgi:ATP-dependent RNA helicase RhlE